MDDGNKVGRPTQYQKEYAKQAYEACLLGATDKELAEKFEVCEKTINTWKHQHPEFLQSIKAGKNEADEKIANSLYRRAMGYTVTEERVTQSSDGSSKTTIEKHIPPDPTSMIFWLKNRQKEHWRDRRELTGADGETLFPMLSEGEVLEAAIRLGKTSEPTKVIERDTRQNAKDVIKQLKESDDGQS